MKRQKQKRPKDFRWEDSLRGMWGQPPSGFYQLPAFEIRGRCLVTQACRKVLDFAPEKICLDMGNFIVTLYGGGLRIESLNGRRLLLTGRITAITFQNKWEEGRT